MVVDGGMSKIDKPSTATTTSTKSSTKRIRTKLNPKRVTAFVEEIFGETEHAKRVQSLANAVVGITHVTVLAIHAIGQAYAQIADISAKSGVKQIDRLRSSQNMVVDSLLRSWLMFVVGVRREIVVVLDWTEFDDDKQTTLAAFWVTDHGRSTPLVWKTHDKATLKGKQKRYEQELIEQLHGWLDPNVRITLLADRGFGDQRLYDFLLLLGWDFVIRFLGGVSVTGPDGQTKTARQWLLPSGRARMIKGAKVTQEQFRVPAVVVTRGDMGQEDEGTLVSRHEPRQAHRLEGRQALWSALQHRRNFPGPERPALWHGIESHAHW